MADELYCPLVLAVLKIFNPNAEALVVPVIVVASELVRFIFAIFVIFLLQSNTTALLATAVPAVAPDKKLISVADDVINVPPSFNPALEAL